MNNILNLFTSKVGLLALAGNGSNTPAGAVITFVIPITLFIVVLIWSFFSRRRFQ